MKFVIAPDSFKESLNALQVAQEIGAGIKDIFPQADCVMVPVADGGEGTVEAMVDATAGTLRTVPVTGPLGQRIDATFGLLGNGRTAVIEMAAASGLVHVPPADRNPMVTTSYGTGELIMAALDEGVRHIVLGIGGSATVDGGMGMMKALGVKFLGAQGGSVSDGGAGLAQIARIDYHDMEPRLVGCKIEIACDVDNPLVGPHGAAAVFGPQKGATPAQIAELDRDLSHYAEVIARDLSMSVADIPGAGAAGGMGAAALAFLNAELRPGIELVLDTIDFAARLDGADFVITGEGRIDSQTIHGKTPIGVARVARQHGVPVIGIAGSLADDADLVHSGGIDAIFGTVQRVSSLDDALTRAAVNVRRTARNVAATLALGMRYQTGRAQPADAGQPAESSGS